MTVAELIEKLKTFSSDRTVVIVVDSFAYNIDSLELDPESEEDEAVCIYALE